MSKNFNFFAFSAKASTGNSNFKRYIGVAPVRVLAVNPNKQQLEEIYGNPQDNEPTYLGRDEKSGVETARIDFILKTVEEKCGVDATARVSFFLQNQKLVGSKTGKIKVIDRYGRTAWATQDEIANHTVPVYSNGPADIDKDYRPAFVGEEQLITFLKAWLGVSNPFTFDKNGNRKPAANMADCEAYLDHIPDYFKGNYSELKELLTLVPNNVVRVLFGIRNAGDNQYQTVYNEYFQKAGASKNSGFEKNVNDRKDVGAYPTTEFEFCDIKEYNPAAPTAIDDMPDNINPADNFFND